MNYKIWAEEYVTESRILKNSIDKEKELLGIDKERLANDEDSCSLEAVCL